MILAERPKTTFVSHVIDFAHEPFTPELVREMDPLWHRHYKEITHYQDIPLNIDLDVYYNAEKNGMFKVFTARKQGELVGYEMFFLHTHPHYKSALEAVQDNLYLSSALRKGLIGYRFMKWNDEALIRAGAQVIFRCVSNRYDYSRLLERMGYVKHDVVYSKRIELEDK